MLNGVLRLSPRVRAREKIGTVSIRLNPVADPRYVEASHSEGVASVYEMLDAFGRAELPDDFLEHVRNVIVDMDDIALSIYRKIMLDEFPISHHLCIAGIEPAPNPGSRVTLIEERDSLGVPKVKLDWRLSELDKFSTQRTMELLGLEVGRLGVGRVQMAWDASSDWPEDMNIGFHHMGTTRMSDTQRNGVVDKNCRVHGVHNLFVAGSSVFATAGSGTPTMAIVALALRLADHVKRLIE